MTVFPFWFSWAAVLYGAVVRASIAGPWWLMSLVESLGVFLFALVLRTQVEKHLNKELERRR